MRAKKTTSGPSAPARKKGTISAKAKADAAAAERQEWGSLQLDTKSAQAIAYQMDGTYRTKALLKHSLFGLGLVTRMAGPHKIEVLFEDGKKLLRCQ